MVIVGLGKVEEGFWRVVVLGFGMWRRGAVIEVF